MAWNKFLVDAYERGRLDYRANINTNPYKVTIGNNWENRAWELGWDDECAVDNKAFDKALAKQSIQVRLFGKP